MRTTVILASMVFALGCVERKTIKTKIPSSPPQQMIASKKVEPQKDVNYQAWVNYQVSLLDNNVWQIRQSATDALKDEPKDIILPLLPTEGSPEKMARVLSITYHHCPERRPKIPVIIIPKALDENAFFEQPCGVEQGIFRAWGNPFWVPPQP